MSCVAGDKSMDALIRFDETLKKEMIFCCDLKDVRSLCRALEESHLTQSRCCFAFRPGKASITIEKKGDSANAVPTSRNCTAELPTFEVIARVISTEVQWQRLALEPPPA